MNIAVLHFRKYRFEFENQLNKKKNTIPLDFIRLYSTFKFTKLLLKYILVITTYYLRCFISAKK